MEVDLVLGILVGGVFLYFLHNKQQEKRRSEKLESKLRRAKRIITLDTLCEYSGEGTRLCYVAVGEKVLDVTKAKQPFVNRQLGGKQLQPEEARQLQAHLIEDNVVGTLLIPRGFTLEELAQFDGTNGKEVYIGASGNVYSVDPEFYGPGGPYGGFAGRDASRALAKVSLDPEDLKSNDISDLTWSEKSTLAEWVAKFEAKYTKVGFIAK